MAKILLFNNGKQETLSDTDPLVIKSGQVTDGTNTRNLFTTLAIQEVEWTLFNGNNTYTLAYEPKGAVLVLREGTVLQKEGEDYTYDNATKTITFLTDQNDLDDVNYAFIYIR